MSRTNPTLLSLALIIAACGGDDGGGQADATPDVAPDTAIADAAEVTPDTTEVSPDTSQPPADVDVIETETADTTPPLDTQPPTGATFAHSPGAGSLSDANHRLILVIGRAEPGGVLEDAQHRLVLGPWNLLD